MLQGKHPHRGGQVCLAGAATGAIEHEVFLFRDEGCRAQLFSGQRRWQFQAGEIETLKGLINRKGSLAEEAGSTNLLSVGDFALEIRRRNFSWGAAASFSQSRTAVWLKATFPKSEDSLHAIERGWRGFSSLSASRLADERPSRRQDQVRSRKACKPSKATRAATAWTL